MSLKAFHILFVVISTLFSLGFAWWAFREYWLRGDITNLLLAIGSFVAALGLMVYGRFVLKKLRGIGYL